jgi:hypothetical protein
MILKHLMRRADNDEVGYECPLPGILLTPPATHPSTITFFGPAALAKSSSVTSK